MRLVVRVTAYTRVTCWPHALYSDQLAVAGQTFADGSALEQSLSDRLDFLNRRFPSRSILDNLIFQCLDSVN